MSSRLKEGLIIGGIITVLAVALVVNINSYQIGADEGDDSGNIVGDGGVEECSADGNENEAPFDPKPIKIDASILISRLEAIAEDGGKKDVTDESMAKISYNTQITTGKDKDGMPIFEKKSGTLKTRCYNVVPVSFGDDFKKLETVYELTLTYQADCVTKPPMTITLSKGNNFLSGARLLTCTAQRQDDSPKDE